MSSSSTLPLVCVDNCLEFNAGQFLRFCLSQNPLSFSSAVVFCENFDMEILQLTESSDHLMLLKKVLTEQDDAIVPTGVWTLEKEWQIPAE